MTRVTLQHPCWPLGWEVPPDALTDTVTTTILSEKPLSNGDTRLAHAGGHEFSKILIFIESSDFITGDKYCQLFSLKPQACFVFRKMPAKYTPSREPPVLSVSSSFRHFAHPPVSQRHALRMPFAATVWQLTTHSKQSDGTVQTCAETPTGLWHCFCTISVSVSSEGHMPLQCHYERSLVPPHPHLANPGSENCLFLGLLG